MSPRSQKIGPHINGLPFMQAIPRSVVYTRPAYLNVEGIGFIPLSYHEAAIEEFGAERVSVVREEYQVADRGTRG